jgi:hypothetical protein
MPRASDPVLGWLRTLIEKRGLNTAEVANKAKLPRARLRKILTGSEPMLVDELLQLSTALEISPTDMGLPEGAGAELPEPDPDALPQEIAPVKVDPWGNHPQQLFQIAFGLGCDFYFSAEVAQLADSGVPAKVLDQFRDGNVGIKLDALHHQDNAPRYDPDGITLTLSFDRLYDCRFPWASIQQIVFFPLRPEPPAQEGPKKPHLRLVT